MKATSVWIKDFSLVFFFRVSGVGEACILSFFAFMQHRNLMLLNRSTKYKKRMNKIGNPARVYSKQSTSSVFQFL